MRRQNPTVPNGVELGRMDRGREARDQGEGVHLNADRADDLAGLPQRPELILAKP